MRRVYGRLDYYGGNTRVILPLDFGSLADDFFAGGEITKAGCCFRRAVAAAIAERQKKLC